MTFEKKAKSFGRLWFGFYFLWFVAALVQGEFEVRGIKSLERRTVASDSLEYMLTLAFIAANVLLGTYPGFFLKETDDGNGDKQ